MEEDKKTSSNRDRYQYDAFISYSTKSDYQLVRKTESFLESFHKIKTKDGSVLRELEVCVDGSDFTLPRGSEKGRNLEPKIEITQIIVENLKNCRYLIVFCSKDVISSKWVNFEIDNRRPG